MHDLAAAKVRDEDVHVLVKQDVLRLEVPVDDVGTPELLQRYHHLRRVELHALARHLLAALDVRQELSVLGVGEDKVKPLLVLQHQILVKTN